MGAGDLSVTKDFAKHGEELVYSDDLNELSQAIGECSLVLSMKFHALVVGAMYSVPVIQLSTTQKNRNLFRYLQRPDLMGNYHDTELYRKIPPIPAPIHSLLVGKLKRDSRLCAIDKYPKKIPADFSIFNYFVAKSPSFEFHIKELSEAFSKENPPKFIYCTRSPEKVWKSLISMPWNNRNVLSFKARYIKSHNCFYNFLKKNGEGTVFDLDSYINDSDKFSYFKHVLDKVGVSIPLASRDKVIQTQNGNSSKAKGYEALSDSAIFDNDFSSIKNDITIFNARDRLLGIS